MSFQHQKPELPAEMTDSARKKFIHGVEEENFTNAWEAFLPKERPTRTFTLRLNDYELALLRAVKDRFQPGDGQKKSMQTVLKEMLVPLMEKRLGVK